MRFVYVLRDESGRVVYVGQSANVADRLRQHIHLATKNYGTHSHYSYLRERQAKTLTWLPSVRSAEVLGPFDRAETNAHERDLIERFQPRGNVCYTARDHRPGIAARSAARAVA